MPANADIPELDVLFVGDFDEEASLLGAKGLGELTAVSVAPAIANAVYHVTGKRVRDLPITVESSSRGVHRTWPDGQCDGPQSRTSGHQVRAEPAATAR